MKRLAFALAALVLTTLAIWTAPEPAFACSCATVTRSTTVTRGTGTTCQAAKDDVYQKSIAMMICSDACYVQFFVTSAGQDGCYPLPDGTYEAYGFVQYRCLTRDCYA